MRDRIALVTGASSGIGAATALALAREGVVIAAVARRADRLDELVKRIEAEGGKAAAIVGDIAVQAEAERVAQQVIDRHGGVDILVNAAGIIRPGGADASDPAHWREMLDINLLATMYVTRCVLPGMRERRDGHVVVVSSTAGRNVGVGMIGYTTSKHAVNTYSHSLRQEVAAFGIRVTIIEPGATATEVANSIPDPKARGLLAEHVSKAGSMSAEDVAGAVLFALKQPPNVNVREIWLAPTAAQV